MVNNELRISEAMHTKEREEAKGSEMTQGSGTLCKGPGKITLRGTFETLTKRSQVMSDIHKHSQRIRMILN